jgi:hypothetical protein
MDREQITAYLRQAADLIDEAMQGLSDDELRRRPSPDEWSILEVSCHLRDYAEIEGQRIRCLVEEDEPTLVPWDQEVLAREHNYEGDDPHRVRISLRAFWGGLAYQLEGLSDEDWQRGGTHPEIGRVTVHSRGELEVEHVRQHLEQLTAIRETM